MKMPLSLRDEPRELTELSRQLCDAWPEHWQFSMKNFHEETGLGLELRAYVDNIKENLKNGRGLILWGEYHTGKTVAATVLLKECMSWGAYGLILHMNQLGDVIVERKKTGVGEEIWKRAYDVHALVIDELKVVVPGFADKMADLIRYRAANRLATFLTTNLKPHDLEAAIGHGTYRKLVDKSALVSVTGWAE